MDSVNNKIYQLARTQVDMVKSALGKRFTFEGNESNETNGGYTTYGTLKTQTAIVVVRLSNHICSMKNWTDRYKQKLIASPKLQRRMGRNFQGPYKDRCFFSIVFKTFDYQPNDIGTWKATCNEYVFNPIEVEKNGAIGNIVQDCMKLNSNQIVTINGLDPTIRTTEVTKKSIKTENKQYNNMNKKLIRLTESDLHRIVKETVDRIISHRLKK